MKVLRLVMNAFGSHQNKIIDFSENFNLITGADPQAVEEIRYFLEGMFFGLSNEDQKRFTPEGPDFKGSLTLVDDGGTRLKIDRDFKNQSFKVTDDQGTDRTSEYLNEYGDLNVLEKPDTIFEETFVIPSGAPGPQKKLRELESQRKKLKARYNYTDLLEQRDEILDFLKSQKKLKETIKENERKIAQINEKIENIDLEKSKIAADVKEQITSIEEATTEAQKKKAELEEQLKDDQNGGLLKKDEVKNSKEIRVIDEKISKLKEEEKVYKERLDGLKHDFTVNRTELEKDYDTYRNETLKVSKEAPEPLTFKLASLKNYVYLILIILGVAGVGVSLANPGDVLTRVPIFLICFVCIFVILVCIFAFYLRTNKLVPVAMGSTGTYGEQEVESLFKKYNRQDAQDFEKFYQEAESLYFKIEELENDLTQIKEELREAGNKRREVTLELCNGLSNEKERIKDKIKSLDGLIEKNKKKLAALREERQIKEEESVWRLKEKSMDLEDKNKELRSLMESNDGLAEDFEKIQKKIDRYESQLHDIEIQTEQAELENEQARETYLLEYAKPGQDGFVSHMAQQFSLGLKNNLEVNSKVPVISYEPLRYTGEHEDELIGRFADFVGDRQALVFTEDLSLRNKLRDLQINGIFVS